MPPILSIPQNTDIGLKKWQVAVLVGAPIAISMAYLYFKNKKPAKDFENIQPAPASRDETDSVVENMTFLSQEPSTIIEVNSLEQAIKVKTQGNDAFKEKRFEDAINLYTTAIAMCPEENVKDLATFYQNRAAAHEAMKNFRDVVRDCGLALSLNKIYLKALQRKAKAHEALGELKASLDDMTSVCILEKFQSIPSIQMTDRILKAYGNEEAVRIFKDHVYILPSVHFLKSYFSSFKEDPVMKDALAFKAKQELNANQGSNEESKPLSGYNLVLDLINKEKFDEDILKACEVEIQRSGPNKAEAMLTKGSMCLLYGRINEAKDVFCELINLDNIDTKVMINALIKLGTLEMQQEKLLESQSRFEEAIKIDPNNCDIYLHRGQINLFMEKLENALEDMKKAVALYPDCSSFLAQKYFVEYRVGMGYGDNRIKQNALQGLSELHDKYPEDASAHFLYGQIMTEKEDFRKADECYKRALKIDSRDATIRAHYGLLLLHWKKDMEQGLKHMNEAVTVDPINAFALESLGTVEVQRGNLKRGIELFARAIKVCRNETELAHIVSLHAAADAQIRASQHLGFKLGPFIGAGESG